MRWERLAHRGVPAFPVHAKNSYASATPVTDGQRVYALVANVGLFCFDFQGHPVWSKRFEPRPTRNNWGPGASPVLYQDRIYVVNDNEEQSYLLALDKRTGEEVWRVPRDEKTNWSTPYVWENARRTEIITPGTGKVRSYDLDGKLLWSFSGMSGITIATPYSGEGMLYVSSGFVINPLRPLYAIRPGASGDISLGADKTSNDFIAWCDRKGAPYNPSTLLYQGRVYVLYDRGTLACFEAQTGEPIYAQQALPDGRAFSASPWAADGKIYCLSEYGVTFVLRAGDKFEILRTNALADDDMCLATPAVAGGRLLLRSSARLYCIRSGAK